MRIYKNEKGQTVIDGESDKGFTVVQSYKYSRSWQFGRMIEFDKGKHDIILENFHFKVALPWYIRLKRFVFSRQNKNK